MALDGARYRPAAVFGCRQGAGVEFAVDCQGQRFQHHHRGRHHVGRQPLGQCGAVWAGSAVLGDITDQAFVAGAVLAGDHHRLIHPIQAASAACTSPSSMRYPRILTCSSARPRYRSCPSAPQHTRSPVRYIRAPAPRTDTPQTATRSTRPGHIPTPTPARRRTTRRPRRPAPDAATRPAQKRPPPPPARRSAAPPTRRQRLTHRRIHRRLGGAVDVDHHPPRRPPIHHLGWAGLTAEHQRQRPKPCDESAATAEGVWLSTLTCSATSKAWKSSGERTTDSGTTTSRPPRSSAAQISHTEKSKAYEWHCDHTCSGGRPTASIDSSSWVTLWWVMATPLGTPVVPRCR